MFGFVLFFKVNSFLFVSCRVVLIFGLLDIGVVFFIKFFMVFCVINGFFNLLNGKIIDVLEL